MLRFKFHHLFAFSLLLTMSWARSAQAMAVNFDLAAATAVSQSPPPAASSIAQKEYNKEKLETPPRFAPLPVPTAASRPPVRSNQSSQGIPHNVIASARVLAPPPPEALPTSRILTPQNVAQTANDITEPKDIGLRFASAESSITQTSPSRAKSHASPQIEFPKWIYEGDSDSLVARVIGSAEGTRAANGTPTRAYYGHTDPGNGVWNMGTFSYQHGAASPKEADSKQLKRLKRQGEAIAHQAHRAELNVTLGEILNGLDLANQAPKAALESGGYVDRLTQAKQKGLENGEAIVWARTYSYINPNTQRWDAPGLGNTLESIQRDQRRRHDAVERAFHSYQAQLNRPQSPTAVLDLAQQPPAEISLPRTPIAEAAPSEKPAPIVAARPLADSLEFRVSKSLSVEHQPTQPSDDAAKATAELPQTVTDIPSTENSSQEINLFEPQLLQSPG